MSCLRLAVAIAARYSVLCVWYCFRDCYSKDCSALAGASNKLEQRLVRLLTLVAPTSYFAWYAPSMSIAMSRRTAWFPQTIGHVPWCHEVPHHTFVGHHVIAMCPLFGVVSGTDLPNIVCPLPLSAVGSSRAHNHAVTGTSRGPCPCGRHMFALASAALDEQLAALRESDSEAEVPVVPAPPVQPRKFWERAERLLVAQRDGAARLAIADGDDHEEVRPPPVVRGELTDVVSSCARDSNHLMLMVVTLLRSASVADLANPACRILTTRRKQYGRCWSQARIARRTS